MLRSLKLKWKYHASTGIGLAILLFGATAQGETLVMRPEQLRLSAAHPVAYLEFRNLSVEETTLHFDVNRWWQEGDWERLTPSRKLMVHPEKITLQAGGAGHVRVVLRLPGPRWKEEAFRILVTQKFPIPDVGVKSFDSGGRRTIRPMSMPVFLLPPGRSSPRISWSLERNSEGALVLRADNRGRVHVRLHSASLLGPAGQSLNRQDMSDIVLPGGARSWELGPVAAAGLWLLSVDTDSGPLRAELELDPDDAPARALTFRQ